MPENQMPFYKGRISRGERGDGQGQNGCVAAQKINLRKF
jgi:hypothetical protein